MDNQYLDPRSPAALNFMAASEGWEACSRILNLAKLSEEDIKNSLRFFKESLKYGEKALRQDPNNPQVKGFVEALRYYYNGLDNPDTDENNQVLFLCLRGNISFFTSMEMVQVSAQMHDQEELDVTLESAMEVINEVSMPLLQEAIAIKPNYTAAKDALSGIQSFLFDCQS
jgi:hypothetical protein